MLGLLLAQVLELVVQVALAGRRRTDDRDDRLSALADELVAMNVEVIVVSGTPAVFAAAQAGMHENKRETFGHSLIIAPWGEILAEGGVEPGVFLAKIDTSKVETARKTVPSLQHGRRFGVADPKAGPDHLHLVRGSA